MSLCGFIMIKPKSHKQHYGKLSSLLGIYGILKHHNLLESFKMTSNIDLTSTTRKQKSKVKTEQIIEPNLSALCGTLTPSTCSNNVMNKLLRKTFGLSKNNKTSIQKEKSKHDEQIMSTLRLNSKRSNI